jgi:hypothetical protein
MRRYLLAFVCEVPVVWSFVYLALGCVLELIALCCRSAKAKEIEILVLRYELAVLRRRHPRPRRQSTDRALLAALSRHLPRARWSVFLVKPETLLGWHDAWCADGGPMRPFPWGDRRSLTRCSS